MQKILKFIYTRLYTWPFIAAVQTLMIHLPVLNKQVWYIAATKLVWTVVILIGNEASGLLTNGRAFRMCIKSFEGRREIRMSPPAYGTRA